MMLLMPLAGTCGCTGPSKETGSAKRTVVDVVGRPVSVPVNPKKVATMQGPTYELLFTLGAKDQIGLVRVDHQTAYPLALLTNPDLKKYPVINGVGPQVPANVEEFISKGVDLVIYWNIAQEIEKFNKAGIPVIVISESGIKPTSLEEALADKTRQISFLADVLGGDAPKRYDEWKKYLDETVAFIQSRTSKIPEDQRPIVYWGNTWNTNILSTYTIDSRKYEVALCGGKLVSIEKGGQFPETTKEQLLAWGPEVIIVDNHGSNPGRVIKDLQTNPDWASMPAVKTKRIYRIPSGVFFIDKGTAIPLYFYWLAKQLHPDLFWDVDLIKEMQYYYKTFYNYELSTAEAEMVLTGWMEGKKNES
jgi:iron complex transport system substrate-binding protein